jgi:hypothetical protein
LTLVQSCIRRGWFENRKYADRRVRLVDALGNRITHLDALFDVRTDDVDALGLAIR